MATEKEKKIATAPESAPNISANASGAPLVKPFDTQKARVRVAKAYKMFVNGAFIRSESGRYFQVNSGDSDDSDPGTINVPRASRKDVRDAVLAAKNAWHGWEKRTAFNRGQILYRLAEVMESRRPELLHSLVRGGLSDQEAQTEVDTSIDRAVYYAGFADKYQALVASLNPVSGPHFGFSMPEPMGVVCVVAPDRPSLLGLVSTILPAVCGGNTVLALASEKDPRTAIVWSECVATSDMPAGVINVLTGAAKEIASPMAKHREVIALDAWMVDVELRKTVEAESAESVKRVKTHVPMDPAAWVDERRGQGLTWIERFLETKTIWHPSSL